VIPALVTLELLDLTEYKQADADWWAALPALADAVAILERECIEHAVAADANEAAQVRLMTASRKRAYGPGSAVHAV
jgi:hypothetical protein